MTKLLIKYGNIVLTTTIGLLTLYYLCLLLLVRLGGYIANSSDFYSNQPWDLPLPPRGFFFYAQKKNWPASC